MHLGPDGTEIGELERLLLGTSFVPPIPGVSLDHHDLSHHGAIPTRSNSSGRLNGVPLLDRTAVFFSSNLGNAATHGVKNLPVVLAGGGFRHCQHLAFDPNNAPSLSKLYATLLHRLGIQDDCFATSTGPLHGLELIG